MGIHYSGGMLVGAHGSRISAPEDYEDTEGEWAEDCGLEIYGEHCGAEWGTSFIGFAVDNILVSQMDGEWLDEIKKLALEFEKLTGVEARLIGAQNIF